MAKNPFDVLGLDPNCDIQEVKRQYQKLALDHHPDRGGNPEIFKEIQKAYEQLKDPEGLKKYQMMDKIIGPMQEMINIDDMSYDEDKQLFWSECRCGGRFEATEQLLEQNVHLVPCDQCSLWIHIEFYLSQE